jgi:hypothetical protein
MPYATTKISMKFNTGTTGSQWTFRRKSVMQLSGLPCPHAISCIFFKTNKLDDDITQCYKVEEFNKTYSYCLMPVEGMQSWPQSDSPPLPAPGYVRMLGRPNKERKREPHEKPKPAKISRVGTIIRSRKCKQIGHNRSTCDKEMVHHNMNQHP